MNRFKPLFRLSILLLMVSAFFWFLLGNLVAEPLQEEEVVEKGAENNIFAEENENCFQCHGEKYYTIKDTLSGEEKTAMMCIDNQVDRDRFYHSVHWSFSCYDCHSEEYNEFPHPFQLRFEDYWTCLDCHGYDENFAQYNFEQIDEDHMKSIHFTASDGDFSCWECHDPHHYKLLTRSTAEISTVVIESNNMCLECHGNEDRFNTLSTKQLGNVVDKHDWLPNQALHFESVRCIDCHAATNDSLLVAHNIQAADSAVRNCAECHSKNSILMGTLYKYKVMETREESGFVNAVMLSNDSYVIGANRSRFLNIVSLVIFALAGLAIGIHVILRINKNKKIS